MDNRKDNLKSAEEILDEADSLENTPTDTDTDKEETLSEDIDAESNSVTSIVDEEGEVEETPSEENSNDEETEQPEAKPVTTAPSPDYRQKFMASSREALIQREQNKKINSAVEEASQIQDVTEDELKQQARLEGLKYEDLTAFEKSMLKRTLISEKQFAVIRQSSQESSQINEWLGKVDDFIDNEDTAKQYPKLAGRESEFRSFAMKESMRGIPLNVVMSAFMFDVANDPTTRKKGSMLLSSTGGGQTAPKPKQLTEEDALAIRKKSPKQYNRMIKEGKIKIDV